MSRKRSRKDRHFRFLKRIWPGPTLAALVSSLGACAFRPVANAKAQSPEPVAADTIASQLPAAQARPGTPPNTSDELRYDWDPQLFPTRLRLAPEFRSACSPVVTLPPSLMLDEKEEVVDALEPIASCLTLGPLAHERLQLVGSSELPGRWDVELRVAPSSS